MYWDALCPHSVILWKNSSKSVRQDFFLSVNSARLPLSPETMFFHSPEYCNTKEESKEFTEFLFLWSSHPWVPILHFCNQTVAPFPTHLPAFIAFTMSILCKVFKFSFNTLDFLFTSDLSEIWPASSFVLLQKEKKKKSWCYLHCYNARYLLHWIIKYYGCGRAYWEIHIKKHPHSQVILRVEWPVFIFEHFFTLASLRQWVIYLSSDPRTDLS